MRDIIIDRPLPSAEAAEALDRALKTTLGEKCSGITAVLKADGQIRIHLTDDATAEDNNAARQIALKHDFSQRTPEQMARAERKLKLTETRENLGKVRSAKTGDAGRLERLEALVEHLLLENEDLRDQLGLL